MLVAAPVLSGTQFGNLKIIFMVASGSYYQEAHKATKI